MINDAFKALSDPTRRKIIHLLREKDRSAGEIADQFNMTKPSISHHLSALKNAKLIQDERNGQNLIYSLNTLAVQEVMGWFLEIITDKTQDEVPKDEQ